MAGRDSGGPDSRSLPQAACSALSQPSACDRRLAVAVAPMFGSSFAWPEAANAAAQAAL